MGIEVVENIKYLGIILDEKMTLNLEVGLR